MEEIPVIKIVFWEPRINKYKRNDSNFTTMYFRRHEEAIRYVEYSHLKIQRMVQTRLPKGDPRII